MRVVSTRVFPVLILLLAASFAVPPASAYSPPQAEYPDLGAGSGVRFHAHKWTPALGAPTSVLDILPQGSPAAGDFNGDGWPDLFFPATRYTHDAIDEARDPSGRLYLNAGDIYKPGFILLEDHFVDVTDVAGLDARGFHYASSWADHDDDGDLDLFVAGYRSAKLFSNDGDSTFTDVSAAIGLPQDGFVLGGAWGDYDGDGDLDLFLAQLSTYTHPDDGLVALDMLPGRANTLLRNDGGVFVDVSAAAGIDTVARRTTSAAFVDFDGDGDLDVYATNYGEAAEAWRNDGGVFTETAATLGIADGARATCQAWEDLDRDGDVDLFVAHEHGVSDGVWLGGGGAFTDVSGTLGLAATQNGDGWGCVAYDYDGDGDMDLVTAHSGIDGAMAQRATLLLNRLDKPGNQFRFADVTPFADASNTNPPYNSMPDIADPMPMSGLATFDWDLNMEPDLVGVDNGGGAHLFKSLGGVTWFPPGDAVHIRLVGATDNHFGVGAKVRVTAGDLDITRQAGSQMSWGGQSSLPLHFGLFKATNASYSGDPAPVDVTVTWPSGLVEHHAGIPAVPPMTLVIEQGAGYRLDMFPPRPQLKLVSGTEGGAGWYVSESVSFDLTAKEPFAWNTARAGTQALRYSTDGVTWTTVANPVAATRLTFEGDGTHTLWIETEDKAGNIAQVLYPVRIDTTPPTFTVSEPAPGVVYVQGRAVGSMPGVDRAVVVSPVVTDLSGLGGAGDPVYEAAGGDGWMDVTVSPTDADSGVARVDWVVRQTNGRIPPGMIGNAPFGPWSWDWPVYRAGPGEFRLTVTVEDSAGHVTSSMHKVLIVPTHPDGITAQPSNPTP